MVHKHHSILDLMQLLLEGTSLPLTVVLCQLNDEAFEQRSARDLLIERHVLLIVTLQVLLFVEGLRLDFDVVQQVAE